MALQTVEALFSHVFRHYGIPEDIVSEPGPQFTSRLPCRKLSQWFVGPFKVLRRVNEVTYRLQLPANYRISPSFLVSQLVPWLVLDPTTHLPSLGRRGGPGILMAASGGFS